MIVLINSSVIDVKTSYVDTMNTVFTMGSEREHLTIPRIPEVAVLIENCGNWVAHFLGTLNFTCSAL